MVISKKNDVIVMGKLIQILPNFLSSIRLILAGLFPLSIEKYWIWLIVAGGVSDVLDGWVARHFNATSWTGRVLDAIADKLFVLSALLTFVYLAKISLWVVPAILARDLMVIFIASYTQYLKAWDTFRQIKSRWSGKIATAGQFLLLLNVALFPHNLRPGFDIAIFLSVSAATDYGLQFVKVLRQKTLKNNKNTC